MFNRQRYFSVIAKGIKVRNIKNYALWTQPHKDIKLRTPVEEDMENLDLNEKEAACPLKKETTC